MIAPAVGTLCVLRARVREKGTSTLVASPDGLVSCESREGEVAGRVVGVRRQESSRFPEIVQVEIPGARAPTGRPYFEMTTEAFNQARIR